MRTMRKLRNAALRPGKIGARIQRLRIDLMRQILWHGLSEQRDARRMLSIKPSKSDVTYVGHEL
jgi:hypothetical protein